MPREVNPGKEGSRRGSAKVASALPFVPHGARVSLGQLRAAAATCKGCDLYKHATQTVFGEGARGAEVMLVGEQPGDREDIEGKPFVGPAGALLDKALLEAGIDRRRVYVTNAVKHFKWKPAPRGKRRIHSKPDARETSACRPWLEAELAVVKPRFLILLGASAAQSLLGSSFRVTKSHGVVLTDFPIAPRILATWHPSAILRAPDEEARRALYASFVADLRVAARAIRAAAPRDDPKGP